MNEGVENNRHTGSQTGRHTETKTDRHIYTGKEDNDNQQRKLIHVGGLFLGIEIHQRSQFCVDPLHTSPEKAMINSAAAAALTSSFAQYALR